MASNELTILEDGDAAIIVDERHWPVVTATWFGAATEALVTRYFAFAEGHLERARKSREKFVLITDTYATSPPSAKVRQRIAELNRAQIERSRRYVLASFAIIESALIRGAVTALSWIDPGMGDTTYVSSFDTAIDGAFTALKNAGVQLPSRPTRARNPNRASSTG